MSILDDVPAAKRERTVTCPTCGAATPWQGDANWPFCSLTCRLVGLGVWLDDRYRMPSDDGGDVP